MFQSKPESKQQSAPPLEERATSAIPADADTAADVDPRSNRAKIERTLALHDRIASRLAGAPPVRIDPRASPIEVVLREWRDLIVAAKAKGWTNKAIAAALRAEGVIFKESSLYLRLAKLYPNGAPHARKPRKRTTAATKGD